MTKRLKLWAIVVHTRKIRDYTNFWWRIWMEGTNYKI